MKSQPAPVRRYPSKLAGARRTLAANDAGTGANAGIEAPHDNAPCGDTCSRTYPDERAGLHERVQRLEGELSKQEAYSRASARQKQHALATMTRELINMATALSDRELRRLDPETLALLTALVNAEDSEH